MYAPLRAYHLLMETGPQRFVEYARRAVESWPELTPEQASRLAVLLRPEPSEQDRSSVDAA